ncbi:hypothetical protein PhCBS80983_g05151 [Powellomyces hirtus]|uniref:F-box domain-containing protein n=1 Tax=Powellomyces hirtus TaxID=109895 RepID=A0A507DV55_9FUNG|nr:hypothetical protein PhCBS80983_g05151 [Powellomyces hirtus]
MKHFPPTINSDPQGAPVQNTSARSFPALVPRRDADLSESQFLRDLQLLAADTLASESERLQGVNALIAARLSWSSAVERYQTRREEVVVSTNEKEHTSSSHAQRGSADSVPDLSSLPEDIILAILRNLNAPALCRIERCSRKFRSLICHYTQPLWRHQVTTVWGLPTQANDPRLSGYFIPADSDWKTVFEERHNFYTGQYRFRMVADLADLESRSRRQELVEERRFIHARKNREYVLHCGQPTTQGSGYAVNLRLCGSYILWISHENLAVCKIDGHTAQLLEGHTGSIITLATNQRDLAVTAAEDATMRVWNVHNMTCIRVLRGVDVLDCAIHENVLVSYNNDNVIDVWDITLPDKLNRIDMRHFDVDASILTREVKIAVWGDNIVCGFENTVFLVICRIRGILKFTLSEPSIYHREEFESTSYPTVLAMYDNILVSRGIRCHEICIWDLTTGDLLYRLSESISFQTTIGYPIRPSEVITDFTLDARGSFLMCTVENEGGDVYLLAWDFRRLPKAGSSERERTYEKRTLENIAGDVRFEYTNFWLCYEA